jgi:hypothetical protein
MVGSVLFGDLFQQLAGLHEQFSQFNLGLGGKWLGGALLRIIFVLYEWVYLLKVQNATIEFHQSTDGLDPVINNYDMSDVKGEALIRIYCKGISKGICRPSAIQMHGAGRRQSRDPLGKNWCRLNDGARFRGA